MSRIEMKRSSLLTLSPLRGTITSDINLMRDDQVRHQRSQPFIPQPAPQQVSQCRGPRRFSNPSHPHFLPLPPTSSKPQCPPKLTLAEPPLPCIKPHSVVPTMVCRRHNGIQLRRSLLLVQGAPAGGGACADSMLASTPGWGLAVVFMR